jgi:biotin transport system permease protein
VVAAALVGVLVAGLAVARLPARTLWAQVRPVWLLLAALFGIHLLVTDALTGTVTVCDCSPWCWPRAVVTATTG